MNYFDYSLKDFLPLIILSSIIVLFTSFKQLLFGYSLRSAMYDFMGSFFLIFSLFKIYNISGFAEAYEMYDVIAKRLRIYAYVYPFIELVLGLLYIFRTELLAANWVVLILMVISSIGVYKQLAKGQKIICACLGAVFNIPMTYVTLAEDILMATMATVMLIYHYF